MKDIIVDTNNVTKDDYPELEGKFVTYSMSDGSYQCVVIGCNRSVGITIVDANDKEHFVICAGGPIMPDHNKFGKLFTDVWDKWFDMVVAGIESGTIDAEATTALYDDPNSLGNCSGSNCAYKR